MIPSHHLLSFTIIDCSLVCIYIYIYIFTFRLKTKNSVIIQIESSLKSAQLRGNGLF